MENCALIDLLMLPMLCPFYRILFVEAYAQFVSKLLGIHVGVNVCVTFDRNMHISWKNYSKTVIVCNLTLITDN